MENGPGWAVPDILLSHSVKIVGSLMVRITVEVNNRVIGEVYPSNGVWVAELDKSISMRSESHLTWDKAVDALVNFKVEQLEEYVVH